MKSSMTHAIVTPPSIRSLYEKIVTEFPSNYAKKQKELTESFNGILQKLNPSSSSSSSSTTEKNDPNSFASLDSISNYPPVLEILNQLPPMDHPPLTTPSSNPLDTSTTTSDQVLPTQFSPIFQSPWELWLPLKSALDVRIHPKVREYSLDGVHKLLSLGLLHEPKVPLNHSPSTSTPPPPPPPLSPPFTPSSVTTSHDPTSLLNSLSSTKSIEVLISDPTPVLPSSSTIQEESNMNPRSSPPSTLDVNNGLSFPTTHLSNPSSPLPSSTLLITPTEEETTSTTPVPPTSTLLTPTPSSTPLPMSSSHGSTIPPPSLLEDLLNTVLTSFLPLNQYVTSEEGIHLHVLKILLTLVTFTNVHHTSLLKVFQACFNIYLYSKNKAIVATTRSSLNQMFTYLITRMEKEEEKRIHVASTPLPLSPSENVNDVFISLKALCRLSFKSFSEKDEWSETSFTVRCRLLAMELMLPHLPMLVKSTTLAPWLGDVFSTLGPDLCMVVTKNATAFHPGLFESALTMFRTLVLSYRPYFKSHLSVLFMNVYFPMVSGNASLDQKQTLLQTFIQFSQVPHLMVEMYANYDCQLEWPSVVEAWIQLYIQAFPLFPSLIYSAIDALYTALVNTSMTESMMPPTPPMTTTPLTTTTTTTTGASSPTISSTLPSIHTTVTPTPFSSPSDPLASLNEPLSPLSPSTPHLPHGSPKDSSVHSHGDVNSAAFHPSELCMPVLRSEEEVVLQKKVHAKHGMELFQEDAQRGLAYLLAYEIIQDTPESIAHFLLTHQATLNKKELGDYLGDLNHLLVFHRYVDLMVFRKLTFVQALRLFLNGFQLPGEAQKIDRIMEKFADKYCEDNPTIFTSADTAYTLAFSIIMLNTDLHSQHIRKRMTKEEFIKNCRGIPSSNTLSDDFFSLVYEDIKENELNVNPPSSLTSSWSKEKVQDEEQRKELFKKETEEIQKTMHSKMLLRSSQASSQTNSNTLNVWKTSLVPEYVKLIFQQCATPVLQVLIQATTTLPSSVTTLSTSLTITTTTTSLFSTTSSNNSSSSNPSTSSSVSSFQVPFLPLHHAILLATHFQLLPELHEHMDVLVTWACTPRSLSSPHPLPALSTSSSVNPSLTLSPASTMHPEAIQWVWRLATMYGAAWDGPTWHSVLQCFSTFEHWNESQTPFEPEVHKHLDCLFVSTAQFPAHVLVCFLQGLCGVSENEQHRPFALKKLVQVACYNINRIRYEFNLIFPLILTHFQDIVLKYPDQDIAAFAVDSLRQLTSKFLDRGDELTHFHSQHEFMHPFLVMMKVSSMQELILTSVQQLIQSRAKHIKSGWKIIFDVLLVGHVNHSLLTESMLFLIHVNVQELLHGHVMIEFIQCLADIGDRSENIALLDLFSQFPLRYKSTTLLGLQKIVLVHAQFDMRRRALEILFQVLDLPYDASEVEETSVSTLDPPPLDAQEEWNLVIFPLFTHNDRLDMIWVQVLQWVLKFFFKRVHATPTTPNWTVGCVPTNNPHQFSDSQLSSTLSLPSTNEIPRTSPVFYRQETEVLVSPDVMTSPLSPSIALPLEHQTVEARIIEKNGVSSSLLNFLSPSWISLYLKGICEVVGLSVTQPHESIAQCAVACYQDLLTWMLTHGTHHDDTVWKEEVWCVLIATLVKLLQSTLPEPFIMPDTLDASSTVFKTFSAKCAVHASVLNVVRTVIHQPVPISFLSMIFPGLKQSREMAAMFNTNTNVRLQVWKLGWTPTPPHLLHQEITSYTLLLLCLVYKLHHQWDASTFHLLQVYGQSLVDEFLQLPIHVSSTMTMKMQSTLSPLIVLLYHHLVQLIPKLDRPFLHLFFQSGFNILKTDDLKARCAVIEFMDTVSKPFWESAKSS